VAGEVKVTGVEGLAKLAKDLRAIDPKLAKELQKTNKEAAGKVAQAAKSAYSGRHRQRSGKGASSIRPLATQTRAQVALGGARAPYMLGQEFGSAQGPNKQQFPPYSGNGPSAGYFFYPAVRAEADKLTETYAKALDQVIKPVFPD
jgi:hypothetical protein